MKKINYNKDNVLFVSSDEINEGEIIKIGSETWQVVYVDHAHALLISHLLLDIRTFHVAYSNPTAYKDSSIREYINNNFLIYNFKRDFLPLIEKTSVTHDNGEVTFDRMFLLSKDEAESYFKSNENRIAIDKFRYSEPWWLRSQEDDLLYAHFVNKEGAISKYPGNIMFHFGLRPAFWLKLNQKFDWNEINMPMLATTDSSIIDKPYVGMAESEIEKTKCGPYYNALLSPNLNSYTWMSYLDCNFLQVSAQNGVVTNVLEMYGSHWNEDGTPKYKGIKFEFLSLN